MKCPICKRESQIKNGDRAFDCPKCKATFEPDSEGIDPTCAMNPTRRIEREEEAAQRRINKLGGRRR